MAPHRDPDTGQFLPSSGFSTEDVETLPFSASFHFDGHTQNQDATEWARVSSWEGVEIVDMDTLLDRHRVAELVHIDAGLVVYGYHYGNDASSFMASVEISASPAVQGAHIAPNSDLEGVVDQEQIVGDLDDIEAHVEATDTVDLPVRPLAAASSSPLKDGTNGPGGGGAQGEDSAVGPTPGPWEFDRRDELYVNGQVAQDGGFAGSGWAQVSGIMTFAIEDT